jgi:hypothetical protein
MSSKSLRHHHAATLFHVLLHGLVSWQAALSAAQCSFGLALLQYSTPLLALHLVRPLLTTSRCSSARCNQVRTDHSMGVTSIFTSVLSGQMRTSAANVTIQS